MITRAKVIKKLDSYGYKWAVNIPILNGIPDNAQEYALYKESLNIALQNNENLPSEQQKSKESIATVVSQQWGNSNKAQAQSLKYLLQGEGNVYIGAWDNDGDGTSESSFSNKISEFTMEASVCGLCGIQNQIHIGDTVYVGFEDNDMGKPIILGHLLTSPIEKSRKEYSNLTLDSIQVKNNCKIPSTTTIKRGTVDISISDLLKMYDFYNAIISAYPGNSLLSTLQNLGSLLSPAPTTVEEDINTK